MRSRFRMRSLLEPRGGRRSFTSSGGGATSRPIAPSSTRSRGIELFRSSPLRPWRRKRPGSRKLGTVTEGEKRPRKWRWSTAAKESQSRRLKAFYAKKKLDANLSYTQWSLQKLARQNRASPIEKAIFEQATRLQRVTRSFCASARRPSGFIPPGIDQETVERILRTKDSWETLEWKRTLFSILRRKILRIAARKVTETELRSKIEMLLQKLESPPPPLHESSGT